MRDEFLRDVPLEIDAAKEQNKSDRFPLIDKRNGLKKELARHPDGILTYIGTLALQSKGKFYDYLGNELFPFKPKDL
jgi:hypothetical protein